MANLTLTEIVANSDLESDVMNAILSEINDALNGTNDTDIDIKTGNYRTGGLVNLDVDGSDVNVAGSLTMGLGNDAGVYYDGTDVVFKVATSGGFKFLPFTGSGVQLDDHYHFDGAALTGLTENDSLLTAYAGKSIVIEGVAFKNGDITAADSITLDLGATIDEFSIDDTLSGDSDTAVPTEQAVKAYVDAVDYSDVGAIQDAANTVNDTHIDWGTGTNQVSTADIPEETNLYYTEARVSANTNVSSSTSHINADGTSHTYINQDIRTTSSPTFVNVTSSSAATADTHLIRYGEVKNLLAGLNWQKSVLDKVDFTTSEPGSPTLGDRYINTATGSSSGTSQAVTEDYIYEWNSATWTEIVPVEGFTLWVEDEDLANIYNAASDWVLFGGVSDHNTLINVQGGTTSEYYHLTAAQHTDLTDAGDSTSHYHATDRARGNHTGTQLAATISDFQTTVSGNSDVSSNSSFRTTPSGVITAGTNLSWSTNTLNAVDTTYSAGTLLDLSGTTFNVDLSELSTSVTNADGDYFVVVDSGNAQKKLTKANINVGEFNNDVGYSTTVGTVTSIATSGAISGGTITSSGTITHLTTNGYKHIPSDGSSGQYLKYSAAGTAAWDTVTVGEISGAAPLASPTFTGTVSLPSWKGSSGATVNIINTSFSDNDTSLMTSQAIKEKIESYSYSTTVGTVTSVSGTSPVSVATGTTTPVISMTAAGAAASGYVTTGTQTFAGAKTFSSTITGSISGNAGGSAASCTGNAATATALATARTIYGNSFNGSANLTQVIASTYGGTGNGFTKFAGPATAEKTFTLPNSNATLLYSGGNAGTPSALVGTNISGTAASLNIGGNAATASAWSTGRTITLTGNVTGVSAAWTGSGNISFAATIANSAVTYAKIQNISATSRLLGRVSAGAGVTEEIEIVTTVDAVGSDSKIPSEQAVREAIASSGGGDVSGPASAVDENLPRFNGTGGKTLEDSGYGMASLCKAWCYFDGTGTPSITDDFNIDTITDNGTGDFTFTFVNNLANVNYCVAGASFHAGVAPGTLGVYTQSNSSVRILTSNSASGAAADLLYNGFTIHST